MINSLEVPLGALSELIGSLKFGYFGGVVHRALISVRVTRFSDLKN